MMCSHSNEAFQVITFQTVVDSGEGPRGPEPSPLFLDQTEAQRGKKNFLGDRPLPYLRVWMTVPPPHPHTLISRSGSATAKNMSPLQSNILYFLLGFSWKYKIIPSSDKNIECFSCLTSIGTNSHLGYASCLTFWGEEPNAELLEKK